MGRYVEHVLRDGRDLSMFRVQRSPSGCVRREIPGATQAYEKRHEGNTEVVTA